MKLATLTTETESLVVGVVSDESGDRFVSLAAGDSSLPKSLREVLSLADWQSRCERALFEARQQGAYVAGRLAAPIPDPAKVICIGLNYRDHAYEAGMEIPSEPVCFGKFGNTIIGPDEPIRLPRVASQVDFEAELVIIMGRRAYEVPRDEAFQYVAGYCNGHDVSARDWQIGKPGKQWLLGKTPDTFAPIGPWLVTSDEIANPHALSIQLSLNGEIMQQGNTSEFIFGVDELIAYLSQIMTLEPGDVIFTGTPPGVGMGRKPPVWLQPGDVVEIEISGLGKLTNPVQSA
ncbi:MAG: fumarylacetoacetate hydrolase family protein [Planctomycetaceae bacterium]|nr:fumarylacetoacetate hydrolase family protein [Planctomycetaceae bacterium]